MAGILSLQLHSVIEKKQVNFRKVEHYIKANHHKGLDLVVLPEYFATNNEYVNSFEPQDGGETLDFIKISHVALLLDFFIFKLNFKFNLKIFYLYVLNLFNQSVGALSFHGWLL